MLLLQGPVSVRLVTWTELQPRFRVDEGAEVNQLLLRQGLGVRLDNNVELLLGYHWQENRTNPDVTRRENRLWQHLAAPLYTSDSGTALSGQFRLEQRRFVGEPDTIWRSRGQFRLDLPLYGPGTIGPMFASETMVNLNGGNDRTRSGFEQQRTSVGISVPFAQGYVFEASYMHQRISRPGPDDIVHVVNLKLSYKLGYRTKPPPPDLIPLHPIPAVDLAAGAAEPCRGHAVC